MTCEHLIQLEKAIISENIKETFRGRAWGKNCREWVYFNCILDLDSLRQNFSFAPCVKDHQHLGTHDGSEQGFYCSECKDGIMGIHPGQPALAGAKKIFKKVFK